MKNGREPVVEDSRPVPFRQGTSVLSGERMLSGGIGPGLPAGSRRTGCHPALVTSQRGQAPVNTGRAVRSRHDAQQAARQVNPILVSIPQTLALKALRHPTVPPGQAYSGGSHDLDSRRREARDAVCMIETGVWPVNLNTRRFPVLRLMAGRSRPCEDRAPLDAESVGSSTDSRQRTGNDGPAVETSGWHVG